MTTTAPGRFGVYGGRYVPETLMANLIALEAAFDDARRDPAFQAEFAQTLAHFVGRPTPLYHARRLGEAYGGQVYLKREDLTHTGAHKINNAVGQALLARRIGKRRIVAETGAGQHGVATAAACARLGLECIVYMGALDCERQRPNVERMRLLGATVKPVDTGSRNLKVAINEAIRDWIANPENTHYLIGSVVGPHPYPLMVREFQRVIGDEARAQFARVAPRPDAVIACVGGGSNAMGIFAGFVDDPHVELFGVEAGGAGGATAATLNTGRPGVLHGALSYLLQDQEGQILNTHSVAAGLDYPGVGPEHSFLKDTGRAKYEVVNDAEALAAFRDACALEGIIPAIESSHAIAFAKRLLARRPGLCVIVNLSGRGDKDLPGLLAKGLV
ncbi:MAG: tryptophan synthase subunit beta [Planctomycetes bacterium]|jgi:tryptophan synthase beta chain|nr:tryptophan synthase subunit beta [Planctomycetota bacterium]MCL4730275.1 tryptophan synthase subunit beta [Planctomycetota bacterium]